MEAVRGAAVIYHLVAGRGKSYPSCFQGSVVTTRNLLDAVVRDQRLKRFVNISSFSVYSPVGISKRSVWDELCPVERDHKKRYDAYAYGKIKQEEIVNFYHDKYGVPYTHIRPGIVFGPGKKAIPGFVGIDTFGIFMHIGGRQRLPLTYVENCADAIALAGLIPGIDGEAFNVVDDDLPTSRKFLRGYKKKARALRSIWIPYLLAYFFCLLWERYSVWSKEQLPPVFNRQLCSFAWRPHRYSNQKIKDCLGWEPRIPMREALDKYYAYQRNG
jgi:nucleoside-diphosphate-sugar epimerase